MTPLLVVAEDSASMKRITIGCAAVSIVLAAAVALACGSSSDAQGGEADAATSDASTTAVDGAGPGPTTDARADDGAASAPVTVTVTVAGAPEAGVTVVFHDATGAAIDAKLTGSDGKASRVVEAGGQVTVAMSGPGRRHLLTFVGVKPGDVLQAVDETHASIVTEAITLPVAPPSPNQSIYVGQCNQFTTTGAAVIDIAPDCIHGSTFPVLAFSNANPRAFTFKKGNSVAVASVTGLPAWTTTVGNFDVDLAHVATLPDAGAVPYVFITHIADGDPFHDSLAPPKEGANYFVTYPGYADSIQAEIDVTEVLAPPYDALMALTASADRGAATRTTAALDVSLLLPRFTQAKLDTSAPGRPQLSWATASPLTGVAAVDGGGATINWTTTLDGSDELGTWSFVLPPDMTSLHAPALPSSLGAWLPTAASTFAAPRVSFVESPTIAGYDQLRATPLLFIPNLSALYVFRAGLPPVPPDTTLRATWIMQKEI